MASAPPATCLLSDPELGIITETDHKVGKCLCSLCTCEKHLCPSRYVNRYNSFETSYAKQYTAGKVKRVEKFGPYLPYVSSRARMELRSSMKSDYQPPRAEKKVVYKTRSTSPSLKFICSTSYSQDYPNWQPSPVRHEKRPILPTRLEELHFNGQSTYKQSFNLSGPHCMSFEDQRNGHNRSSSMIGVTNVSYFSESTSRRSFKELSSFADWNEVVKQPRDAILRLETPECHHITTNSANFRPVALSQKDPTVLRRKKLASLKKLGEG